MTGLDVIVACGYVMLVGCTATIAAGTVIERSTRPHRRWYAVECWGVRIAIVAAGVGAAVALYGIAAAVLR